jgi:hypothetical protein
MAALGDSNRSSSAKANRKPIVSSSRLLHDDSVGAGGLADHDAPARPCDQAGERAARILIIAHYGEREAATR